MGARDCTRASSATCARSPRVRRLQWGRAIVRAQARRRTGRRRGANGSFNGGARLYARKRRRARIRRASSTSFNGGARLYARKPLRLGRDGLGRHASMGARDCTRASAAKAWVAARRAAKLQWRRAIVRAQAQNWCPQLHRALVGFNGGARLYARKPAGSHRAASSGRWRFNGGARLYARKRSSARPLRSPAIELQWGRAIVRAQASPNADGEIPASVLQWGRAIVCAQASTTASRRCARSRFNGGARLYARKPMMVRLRRDLKIVLQWGRAIVRAQARHSPTTSTARRMLQWGRAIVRAQARLVRRRHGRGVARFNGGARLYARKRGFFGYQGEPWAYASMGRAIVRAQA